MGRIVSIIVAVGLLLMPISSLVFGEQEVLPLLGNRGGKDGHPEGWRPLVFPKISRHTRYQLIQEEGRPTILAESRQSASGIYHPLDLDPKAYPILSWCWKINRIISKGDAMTKKGDDYAARVYVTFKYDPDKASFSERTKFGLIKLIYGEYPPKGAIDYIWANRLPKGKMIPNAYTDRAQMVAVESGEERVGRRICEERNLYEDYRKLFGETPPRISGVAVMTDTDNTGEEATAYYSDLVIRSAAGMGNK